jgi:hypothetical protein
VTAQQCSWCGVAVEADEGYRAAEPAGDRAATFCRLEHVVPWVINGAHWDAGKLPWATSSDELPHCAQCGEPVGDVPVVLVHHRGEHRIADALCSVDHLRVWAAAGGRWR